MQVPCKEKYPGNGNRGYTNQVRRRGLK